MYIQNRRDSSKFNSCSPLQNCSGLISLKPAIAYFAYTHRYAPHNQKSGVVNQKLILVDGFTIVRLLIGRLNLKKNGESF